MAPAKARACDYCDKTEGIIQYVAIGQPGRLDVHVALLHPECEQAYLRMISDE